MGQMEGGEWMVQAARLFLTTVKVFFFFSFFFRVHVSAPPPPFPNNQLSVFASLALLSFQRFVFEKVAIIAKWLLFFCKHGKALGRAPVSRPGS